MNDNALYRTPRYSLPDVFGPWPSHDAVGQPIKPTRCTLVNIAATALDFRLRCERATAQHDCERFFDIQAAMTPDQQKELHDILKPVPIRYQDAIIRAVTFSIMLAERRQGTPMPPEKFLAGLRTVSPRLYRHFAIEPARALDTFYHIFAAEHRNLMRTIRQNATLLPPQELPEFKALCSGPEAMRNFVARGGAWHEHGMAGVGSDTLAHFAATTTTAGPDVLAAFIQTGGHFHSKQACGGDTPLHYLMFHAGSPQTLYALAEAGLRFDPKTADATGCGPYTPRSTACMRSESDGGQSSFYHTGFVAAFDHLLTLSERSPCRT